MTQTRPPSQRDISEQAGRPTRDRGWFAALALRLHFYAGIFIGPFILVAAVSGALYALSPQIENAIYAEELTATSSNSPQPLAAQVRAAKNVVGADASLAAVRPAEPGGTTRVMFADPNLERSETRALFVDPGTTEVKGDLTTYGTSGALPLRTWIDQLHRSLHLGDAGRAYSELAASWLWVIALGGLALWVGRWRRNRRARGMLVPDLSRSGRPRILSWHASVGIWLLVFMLFLSATGLTWSQWAGSNVGDFRAAIGWGTPSVSTDLVSGSGTSPSGHAAHEESAGGSDGSMTSSDPAMFDHALEVARGEGIDADKIEITPPPGYGQAWSVTEIDRSWPTQVDAVAIDPATMAVTDSVRFEDYSIGAKLARWGIDAHMGVLFGLANQLVLAVGALGLASMVVWGYLMWWKRRPTRASRAAVGSAPRRGAFRRVPLPALLVLASAALGLGLFLPVFGITLAAFLVVDTAVGVVRHKSG